MTAVLWLEAWAEILGFVRSPDDLSKLYLATMGAYAGAAEISKWLNGIPTDPTQDPRFERIQRGGFFVWLWLVPLFFAYGWRLINPAVPMPESMKKITIGLVGIFFLKAASRRLRHKKNGVIDPVTGELKGGSEEEDLTEALHARIATIPEGMTPADITAAFPDKSKPALYRELDALIKAKRLTRVGKPRTADVRYRAVPTLADQN